MGGRGCAAKNEAGVSCKNQAQQGEKDGFCVGHAHRFEGERFQKLNPKQKMIQEMVSAGPEFKVCTEIGHESKSLLPRDKVPIELFRKTVGDPNSALVKTCKDCRDFQNAKNLRWRKTNAEKAKLLGMVACVNCCAILSLDGMAKNLDGSLSTRCEKCQLKINLTNDRTSITMKQLKMERINEQKCCCIDCKRFFMSDAEERCAICIEPDENGFYMFEGKLWSADLFLENFKSKIEIRILELDHLPEDIQRQRGIIAEGQPALKKRKIVFDLKTEHKMRQEIMMCDLVCSFCHMIRTISRRGNSKPKSRKKLELYAYANAEKKCGCEFCGYKNEELLPFFEFDHIDPSQKLESIGAMCGSGQFTLTNVMEERKKCRVLCKFCHRLRTSKDQKSKKVR